MNFIPEEFEIKDPPIIVISKKYKLKLLSDTISVSPELAILLVTLKIMSKPSKSLKYMKVQIWQIILLGTNLLYVL